METFSISNYNFTSIIFLLIALTLITQFTSVESLRLCYYCNATANNLDCVHNPSNVTDGEIKCKGYCTILRKDYLYMPEDASLVSLQRGCELNPAVLDGLVVDGYFKIYYRSCKSFLCNAGLGIDSLKDIPIDPSWDLYTDEEYDTNDTGSYHRINFAIFPTLFIFYQLYTWLI